MSEIMERMVVGTVEDVNPLQGYIQVGASRRGSRIVVTGPDTAITQLAPVPLSELAVGDRITVTGVPVAIQAESLLFSQPLGLADVLQGLQTTEAPADPEADAPRTDRPEPEPPSEESGDQNGSETPGPASEPEADTPGEPSAPAPGFAAGPPTPAPTATFPGTVKSLEPLVVELDGGQQITVVLSDQTSALRRADADMSAVIPGQEIVAVGDVNEDGYLAAAKVYLGESLSMGRMFGGRGGPGPSGSFRGGPRGGRPSEPRTPFEEE
jgi:hypothetical protein